MGDSPDRNSDDSREEDLPMVSLKKEDKVRVIKGMILLLLFSSIVIYSLIYCNAPNYRANILFTEDDNDRPDYIDVNKQFPFYVVNSRRIYMNMIELSVSDEKSSTQLRVIYIFSKNRVRMKIINANDKQYEIPIELFDLNDIEFTKEGIIDSVSDSNIGVHIDTYPFGFKLYRKESNEIFFNTLFPYSNETYFTYNENYMRISSTLVENHFTYGLGYNKTSLRVIEGDYFFWNNWTYTPESNSYLSIPNFVSGNPKTLNFYGVFMFNSSPMRIRLKDNIITYEISGGVIDIIIIDGPKPKDITIQLQKTFGMPFLPSIEALNWMGNIISKNKEVNAEEVKDLLQSQSMIPMKLIWVEDNKIDNFGNNTMKVNDYEIVRYTAPIQSIGSEMYREIIDRNICLKYDNGSVYIIDDYCIIDNYNPNTSLIYQSEDISYRNLIYQVLPHHNEDFSFSYPFNQTNLTSSLPLNIKLYDNSTMLCTHNIFSLKQTQLYHNISMCNKKRNLLFSQSTFIGSEQYTGKWLGYFPPSWEGLKDAIRQTLNFNLLGSANLIHEACGYSEYNSNEEINKELCVRWIQFSSVSAYSRINGIERINSYEGEYKDSIINSVILRERLSLYIYSTMIKNYIDGGFLIMPIFAFYTNDFNTDEEVELLFENEIQFMLGPNLMIAPVVTQGERTHKTFFPKNEIIYNFYTGEMVNNKKERYIDIPCPLDSLLIFARGGFITPLLVQNDTSTYIENLRFNPVELIIALDDNYESQGKLFIDDGENVDRLYYKMDFVSLYDDKNKNIEIIFKKVYESFTIPEKWFPYIERVTIYGIGNAPSRVTYFRGGDDEKEIPKEKIKYDTNKKVLVIELQSEQILKSKNNTIRFILEGIIKE